jgi:hypothetical protein
MEEGLAQLNPFNLDVVSLLFLLKLKIEHNQLITFRFDVRLKSALLVVEFVNSILEAQCYVV